MSKVPLIEKAVSRLKRERVVSLFLEFCARFAGAFVFLLGLGLGLDHFWPLSASTRRGFWIFSAALLFGAFVKWAVRPFLSFDVLKLLDEAEEKFPFLRRHVKSAWELSRARTPDFASPDLKASHIDEAERRIAASQKISLRPAFSLASLLRLSAVGLLTALLIFSGDHHGLWARILWPWENESLEKIARIAPGDVSVDWGSPAQIQASWSTNSILAAGAGDLKIFVNTSSGWESMPWDFKNATRASFKLAAINSPIEYRLTWKDLVSRNYLISPVLTPGLLSLRARLENVDSDWTPLSAESPLTVLAGHVLLISGSPNQDLKNVQMRVSTLSQELTMKKGDSGDYRASFFVGQAVTLSFDLESSDGRKNANPDHYEIKTVPDQAPTAQILYPEFGVEGSPRDTLPISYLAKDDGGLIRLSLIVTFPNGTSQETEIERPGNLHEFYGDYSLDLSTLPLGVSRFQIKAYDNAHPSQSGISSPGMINVVDFEARHKKAEEMWKEAEESLRQLISKDQEALSALPPAKPQKFSDARQALSAAEKKSLQDIAALKNALERDPYAGPALSRAMEALGNRLAHEENSALKNADSAARENHWEKAKEQLEHLLKSAGQAEKLLSEARKTQGLADAASETGRMSDKASDLESKLSQMAKGKTPSAEEKAALNRSLAALKNAMQKLAGAMKSLPSSGEISQNDSTMQIPLEEAQRSLSDLEKAMNSGDYSKAAEIAKNLANQMETMRSAMTAMAQNSAFSATMSQAARDIVKARKNLSQAIQEENALREKTQALESERMKKNLAAQEDLLKKLSAMQGVLISSAEFHGAEFPVAVLNRMRDVRARFDSGSAGDAESVLAQIYGTLRGLRSWRPKPFWEYFISGEDEIRRLLKKGVPPPPADAKKSQDLAGEQNQARKTVTLTRKELGDLEFTVSDFPKETLDHIDAAGADEAAAESSLNSAQSQEALGQEGNALSHLNGSLNSLDQALQARGSPESFLMSGLEGSGSTLQIMGGGQTGMMGAKIGLVPLPASKDYQPLKKLRHEIERSLQEKSPTDYQDLIKAYFRRIAQ